jgi:hypothetical protein
VNYAPVVLTKVIPTADNVRPPSSKREASAPLKYVPENKNDTVKKKRKEKVKRNIVIVPKVKVVIPKKKITVPNKATQSLHTQELADAQNTLILEKAKQLAFQERELTSTIQIIATAEKKRKVM